MLLLCSSIALSRTIFSSSVTYSAWRGFEESRARKANTYDWHRNLHTRRGVVERWCMASMDTDQVPCPTTSDNYSIGILYNVYYVPCNPFLVLSGYPFSTLPQVMHLHCSERPKLPHQPQHRGSTCEDGGRRVFCPSDARASVHFVDPGAGCGMIAAPGGDARQRDDGACLAQTRAASASASSSARAFSSAFRCASSDMLARSSLYGFATTSVSLPAEHSLIRCARLPE